MVIHLEFFALNNCIFYQYLENKFVHIFRLIKSFTKLYKRRFEIWWDMRKWNLVYKICKLTINPFVALSYGIIMIGTMMCLLHPLSALTNGTSKDIARFIGLWVIHIIANRQLHYLISTPALPDFESVWRVIRFHTSW